MKLYFLGYALILVMIILLFEFYRFKKGTFITGTLKEYMVNIVDFEFSEPFLVIERGDKIKFKNFDQVRHQIITDEEFLSNSPLLLEFDEFTETFNETGTFYYYSPFYKKMKAIEIIVE